MTLSCHKSTIFSMSHFRARWDVAVLFESAGHKEQTIGTGSFDVIISRLQKFLSCAIH